MKTTELDPYDVYNFYKWLEKEASKARLFLHHLEPFEDYLRRHGFSGKIVWDWTEHYELTFDDGSRLVPPDWAQRLLMRLRSHGGIISANEVLKILREILED
jgi:hypothetical protein